eukprot:TRINITY_DN1687_c0_g1_i2.p1 TRINITY_DN1687_c0_g1~~TRINITY_DN1687_c0_g1_i2.p1  ORF type:complete len:127 (-),score=9.89 TRINITY_DN1687_c0_g1_i2:151-531(-)
MHDLDVLSEAAVTTASRPQNGPSFTSGRLQSEQSFTSPTPTEAPSNEQRVRTELAESLARASIMLYQSQFTRLLKRRNSIRPGSAGSGTGSARSSLSGLLGRNSQSPQTGLYKSKTLGGSSGFGLE